MAVGYPVHHHTAGDHFPICHDDPGNCLPFSDQGVLFYPVLILDVVLLVGLFTIIASAPISNLGLSELLTILSIILVIIIDIVIITVAWKKVR